MLIRHLRQLKTVVFLHWCLICVLLSLKAGLHGQYFLAILLSNAISRRAYCRAQQFPGIEKFLLKLHCSEISHWSCQDKAIKKPWNLKNNNNFQFYGLEIAVDRSIKCKCFSNFWQQNCRRWLHCSAILLQKIASVNQPLTARSWCTNVYTYRYQWSMA